MKRWAATFLIAALSACTSPAFRPDVASGPTPWTHTPLR